jgi:hypothetical protein
MKTRHRNPSRRLATQAAELSLAAPQVVVHRLARMASAGATPSAADRREFARMGTEKVAAFWQSWFAMGLSAWQQAWQPWTGAWGWPATPFAARARRGAGAAAVAEASRAAGRILAAGLAPVHGRAVANAKRLARRRSR